MRRLGFEVLIYLYIQESINSDLPMRILHLEKAVLQSSIAPNINTSIPIAVYLAVVSVIQKDVKLLEGQENERINSLE